MELNTMILKKSDWHQPFSVFDFTSDQLIIARYHKGFHAPKKLRFEIRLTHDDFTQEHPLANKSFIDISDFHEIISLMIGYFDMVTTIWINFFLQYRADIEKQIHQTSIVIIIPMTFEPENRRAIVHALHTVFGRQYVIQCFLDAVPLFFLGIYSFQLQSESDQSIIFEVEHSSRDKKQFEYVSQIQEQHAVIQFMGYLTGVKAKNTLTNYKTCSPVFDGFHVMASYFQSRYYDYIPFHWIHWIMPVQVGFFTADDTFMELTHSTAYTFHVQELTPELNLPVVAKTRNNNLFFLKPLIDNRDNFRYENMVKMFYKKINQQKAVIEVNRKGKTSQYAFILPALFS